MPLYDCGAPECEECETAFGPDRSKAIAHHEARGRAYAKIEAEAERDMQTAVERGRVFRSFMDSLLRSAGQ